MSNPTPGAGDAVVSNRSELQARFDRLAAADGAVDEAELATLFAALPAVELDFLLGSWAGGEFVTGHAMNGMLAAARWHGKRFDSLTEVHPLICLDENGTKFSNKELGKGLASLWNEEFRGQVTATMVYDGQPTHDHFKLVDADTVLGVMNGKRSVIDGKYFYFYLRREA